MECSRSGMTPSVSGHSNITNAEPEGARGAPDKSGQQAPVTKLSRRLPVGVAIYAVAQWRIFKL